MARVRLGYRVALSIVLVVAAAVVAVTEVHAARRQLRSHRDAAAAAVARREWSALTAQAGELVAAVSRSPSLQQEASAAPCRIGAPSLCFNDSARPARAISSAVAALASVTKMQPTTCTAASAQRRTFSKQWTPCSAHAQPITDSNGQLLVSITAFPVIDRSRSRPGHLTFAGTHVSLTTYWVPAPA